MSCKDDSFYLPVSPARPWSSRDVAEAWRCSEHRSASSSWMTFGFGLNRGVKPSMWNAQGVPSQQRRKNSCPRHSLGIEGVQRMGKTPPKPNFVGRRGSPFLQDAPGDFSLQEGRAEALGKGVVVSATSQPDFSATHERCRQTTL